MPPSIEVHDEEEEAEPMEDVVFARADLPTPIDISPDELVKRLRHSYFDTLILDVSACTALQDSISLPFAVKVPYFLDARSYLAKVAKARQAEQLAAARKVKERSSSAASRTAAVTTATIAAVGANEGLDVKATTAKESIGSSQDITDAAHTADSSKALFTATDMSIPPPIDANGVNQDTSIHVIHHEH
ncbi:hypothetical protein HDV05_007045, partial [Chytridiales sp. JEL 0842]